MDQGPTISLPNTYLISALIVMTTARYKQIVFCVIAVVSTWFLISVPGSGYFDLVRCEAGFFVGCLTAWTAQETRLRLPGVADLGIHSAGLLLVPQKGRGFRSNDIRALRVSFLLAEYNVHAFRVDERKSSNAGSSGSNQWLYPDIVGLESLALGLNLEVAEAIKVSSDRKVKLWSLEIKVLLNRSNVREAYYQAVSNSSWANLGYLVAAQIEGLGTLQEVRILYGMHGIGLIKLDKHNPAESEILIPARERPEIEWAMCSRLANEKSRFSYLH